MWVGSIGAALSFISFLFSWVRSMLSWEPLSGLEVIPRSTYLRINKPKHSLSHFQENVQPNGIETETSRMN